MQKGSMKKVVKSKVVAQKWLWWSDNSKFLITTIQVNFGANSQSEKATQFAYIVVIENFPLSDHHSHFWPGPPRLLQFGCFCVD